MAAANMSFSVRLANNREIVVLSAEFFKTSLITFNRLPVELC